MKERDRKERDSESRYGLERDVEWVNTDVVLWPQRGKQYRGKGIGRAKPTDSGCCSLWGREGCFEKMTGSIWMAGEVCKVICRWLICRVHPCLITHLITAANFYRGPGDKGQGVNSNKAGNICSPISRFRPVLTLSKQIYA